MGVATRSSPDGASGGSPGGGSEGHRLWWLPDPPDQTLNPSVCVLRPPVRANPDVAAEVRGTDVTRLRSQGATGRQEASLGGRVEGLVHPLTVEVLNGYGASLQKAGRKPQVPSWWVQRSQARISAIFLEGAIGHGPPVQRGLGPWPLCRLVCQLSAHSSPRPLGTQDGHWGAVRARTPGRDPPRGARPACPAKEGDSLGGREASCGVGTGSQDSSCPAPGGHTLPGCWEFSSCPDYSLSSYTITHTHIHTHAPTHAPPSHMFCARACTYTHRPRWVAEAPSALLGM